LDECEPLCKVCETVFKVEEDEEGDED
jgi:hypothetical protein